MSKDTTFFQFAELCDALEATSKRKEKKLLICNFLRKLHKGEIQPTTAFLIGKAFGEGDARVLNVGGRTIMRVVKENKQATLIFAPLTIHHVAKIFSIISSQVGKGSRAAKENLLRNLLNQATPLEEKYLVKILLGEMQIGAVEGIVLEAIAEAAGANLSLLRRAYMILGSLGEAGEIALNEGVNSLKNAHIRLFKPVRPMLAEMAYDLDEVVNKHGGVTAFEYKFDGARIQIHKRGSEVKIFSRRLMEVTDSVPDLVDLAKKEIHSDNALVEGETVACSQNGKPLPFQDLMRRFVRIHKVDDMVNEIPLKLYLFDILYLDGRMLIDVNYEERWKLLAKICESNILAPRIITGDAQKAKTFLELAIKAGHEGLMAKALSSDYTPGTRGKKWFKIKPFERLDLVIIAADWGYGRRKGWLSNYHLAARDEVIGNFVELGKTFKGLTDQEFNQMTKLLQKLKTYEKGYTVYVRPEVVVEVAYNEIQHSYQYKSGFSLRFARIARIRTDKGPMDIDSISKVRELYEEQFKRKAKTNLQKLI